MTRRSGRLDAHPIEAEARRPRSSSLFERLKGNAPPLRLRKIEIAHLFVIRPLSAHEELRSEILRPGAADLR
jgi:hypothetical protein